MVRESPQNRDLGCAAGVALLGGAQARRSGPALVGAARRHALIWLAAATLLGAGLAAGCAPRDVPVVAAAPQGERPGIAGLLQGDAGGYARAAGARIFSFPADHGAHPGFRTEWWYVTGQLADAAGRRFGFQFTVFRQALAPPRALAPAGASARPRPRPGPGPDASWAGSGRPSAWRADQAWLAHLAVTDITAGQHWSAARLSRGALGLAGATANPMAVWVEDWRFAQPAAGAPMTLRARDPGGMVLDLQLVPDSAVVLHGEAGLSRKGEDAASYYYSVPRWRVRGRIGSPALGTTTVVGGTAWLDREWSTSALTPQQIGWDWFALRLNDGRALMLFQLRRADGRRDGYDAGSLIARDGTVQRLVAADFTLAPGRTWRDEQGVSWPTQWTLRLHPPRRAPLELTVVAEVDDQLLRVGLRYWEGAVRVSGAVRGEGYLEMTGYRSADGQGRAHGF